MSEIYSLTEAEINSEWDEFVKSSPDGTVFSYSTYLKNINGNVKAFYCLKNKEKHAGVVVVESEDRSKIVSNKLLIYNGIINAAPPENQNNISAIRSENFKVAEFIANELAEKYSEVSLTLPPTIIDIRPFLWYNYGSQLPKYAPQILYTTFLNLTEFIGVNKPEDYHLFNQFSYSRRQEVRYAMKKGVYTNEEFKVNLFIDFYKKTMERQDEKVDDLVLAEMETLITALLKEKLARMFVSYTSKDEPGSMALIGIDNKSAHYIFGANDPGLRNTHTGTAVLWDSFRLLGESGIKEINLEGVNSPRRGWFKLSFGGDLRPYFRLSFTK